MSKTFEWSEIKENLLLSLREEKRLSFRSVAEKLGTTEASVKHKYQRLTQSRGDNRYHHPKEKINQLKNILPSAPLRILETNAGWGNLTQIYQTYGSVLAQDIDLKRVDFVKEMNLENVVSRQVDSFKEIHKLIYDRERFDVVDLDPYGMPSRYFPHVFQLMQKGWLFVTFPKIGVQKINKITIEHLRVFWGIDLATITNFNQHIHNKIKDFGMQSYRSVEVLDELDLGRMMRFAYKVEQRSALELVGLTVNRGQNQFAELVEPNLFNFEDGL